MLRPCVIFMLITFAAAPAGGQTQPDYGIGFVHADDRTFYCRESDPVEALECARDQCREMAPGQSCVRAAWCFPSGWSAIVRTWRGDLALPSAVCGAPTDIAMQRTVAEYCRSSDNVTSCDLMHMVDPAGFETAVEGMQFPGGAPAEADMPVDEGLPNGAAPDALDAGAVDAEPAEPEAGVTE